MTAPLLVEIGCEELPIHAIDELAQALMRGMCEGLSKRDIATDSANARAFCTPRRLAVHMPGVAGAQPEQKTEIFGPYLNIALDAQGAATKALRGFAQKIGVEWTQLERASDVKGERFVYRATRPGQMTATLLPSIVDEALTALPIPRPMRWDNHEYSFVRPVHWLVMLHGDRVIDGEVLGLKSGRQSRGHRFMHPQPVHIVDADSYIDALRMAKVLADPAQRRQRIRDEVTRAARSGGGVPRLDDALLDEIANLTEWPVAIACGFDSAFLAVPHEALVMTMESNQKFVPVFDGEGKLTERFIGVANLESKDEAQIRHGYERVIRPRFADAKFFYDEDLKTPLTAHQQALQNVTYQQSLGSVWDKCVRVAELARGVVGRLRAQGVEVDAALTTHAAALSRCDLLTRMVGEFPELQGVMGRYYAAAQGEPAEVANALDEFYRPRHAGDGIAQGKLAQVLSVADKLDTLAGIFAVGMKPSGNKDPFALRRAALGLARTLIEGGLDLDLRVLWCEVLERIPERALEAGTKPDKDGKPPNMDFGTRRVALADELHAFIFDRLRGYYADQGFTPQQFDAVATVEPASLVDFDRRLRAVAAFARRPEAANLAAANKRVANILRKEGIDARGAAARSLDRTLLHEAAEQSLALALDAARSDTQRLFDATRDIDYETALARLAQLQTPIDAFFGGVMVVAEDAALRANRLTLLAQIKAQFDAIADIALL
ncbi:MAG: glycine--tRNA ligase subunit beta [Pseudomonadota bacterium]|nr:glycine--tRNA ligase subunit beta [Pseudomonadota bacterium]